MWFTLGTDTELFAVDNTGKHRSLCGLVGGSKESPAPMKDLPHGFAYQEDNVAVEFNIPPCSTSFSWSASVATARDWVKEQLQNSLALTLSPNCAVSFDKSELTHPNALVFGCEPDYDAWKMVENKKPTCDDPTLRTAGGHIHVGTDSVDMVQGVRNMDLFLGVPSVLLDDKPDSVQRRQLYGKHGAMRPKPYGWEYRVLSNFWVFDGELIDWVWNATSAALKYKHKFTKKEATIIQNCIDSGDKETALNLVKHYKLVMPTGWNYESTNQSV